MWFPCFMIVLSAIVLFCNGFNICIALIQDCLNVCILICPDIGHCFCQVQKGIGAVNAVCMDINAACSGFVFGLNTAVAYARAGMGKKMMIIGVETLSKILDWSDRSTCVLFGDGAGCAIVEADEEREIFIDAGSEIGRAHV